MLPLLEFSGTIDAEKGKERSKWGQNGAETLKKRGWRQSAAELLGGYNGEGRRKPARRREAREALKSSLGIKLKKRGESRRVIKRQANGRQGDSASR